jgi:nicotinamide-nucleotide amidase
MKKTAQALSASVADAGVTLAVAESLTGGQLSSAIAAAENASEWFRGGVVAYASEVKFTVLGVTPGPVVTEQCAREMASGVCRLMDSDVGVGITGVGGPGSEEGHPEGTVFAAVHTSARVVAREWRFDGDPEEVLEQAVRATLGLVSVEVSSLINSHG